MLANHLKNSLLLILTICCISTANGALTGDTIEQQASEGSIAVVHTGTGNVTIGITFKEYEQGLKEREKQVTARLKTAHDTEKKALLDQFESIKKQLLDSKGGYEARIKDLRERILQLEALRGTIPDDLLQQAQVALAEGDTQNAENLFKQVEQQAEGQIKAAAEAKYQRCR